MPIALEQSRELRMAKISCSEHETTLSTGGGTLKKYKQKYLDQLRILAGKRSENIC